MQKEIRKFKSNTQKLILINKAIPVTQNIPDIRLSYLLNSKNQIQVFHWQTRSYAEHIALGEIYDSFSEFLDSFIESFQGIYGRVEMEPIQNNELINYDEMEKFYDSTGNFISGIHNVLYSIKETINNSELQNSLEEIIGKFDKTRYLLTLN